MRFHTLSPTRLLKAASDWLGADTHRRLMMDRFAFAIGEGPPLSPSLMFWKRPPDVVGKPPRYPSTVAVTGVGLNPRSPRQSVSSVPPHPPLLHSIIRPGGLGRSSGSNRAASGQRCELDDGADHGRTVVVSVPAHLKSCTVLAKPFIGSSVGGSLHGTVVGANVQSLLV